MTINDPLSVQPGTYTPTSVDPYRSSSAAKPANASFGDTLQSSMLMQLMSSLDSSSGGLGSSAGSSSGANISMMFSLISLYEQLIAQQMEKASSSSAAASQEGSGVSRAFHGTVQHINQFVADLQVGGDGANANCGPTSLVMALRQIGLRVAGERDGASDGEAVDLARRSMAASSAKDGVDASGNRADAEHSTYTDFSDLARGAAAAGAHSQRIWASADGIRAALQRGASVVASGTFAGKYPPPWTGDRGFDNNSAPGNATAHLIEVSAYDPATDTFTVHDPARSQSHQVSAAALERFMAGNAGAMALWR